MRIIAGKFRGRRLLAPADQATRPITDRVKQSLFDILAPRLEGPCAYDVFSGTGSLGLEALSRGADSCIFFERHRPAVLRLKRNIDTLGVGQRCRIVSGDVLKLSEADLTALPRPDVVFFDPPYPLVRDQPVRLGEALVRFAARVSTDGVLVLRLAKQEVFDAGLRVLDERTWGTMRIVFLGREPVHQSNVEASNTGPSVQARR